MSSTSFFVMAKPDSVKRGLVGEIISRFEKKGFVLLNLRYLKPEDIEDVIREHYKEHETKSFYNQLIQFSLSGPVCAMIWKGRIEVARKIVGSTIPEDALPGSIRGDYCCSLPENLIHCSDSADSAYRELSLWSKIMY